MNPNINEPELPIRFGGVELSEKRHICGFFRTLNKSTNSCFLLSQRAWTAARRRST